MGIALCVGVVKIRYLVYYCGITQISLKIKYMSKNRFVPILGVIYSSCLNNISTKSFCKLLSEQKIDAGKEAQVGTNIS